ncbi:MAG: hypothetical protein R2911_26260 [Caldilineaceae bacterium]
MPFKHIDDSQLLAYVEGDAEPDVVAQIEQDPHCQARLRELTKVQDTLRQTLFSIRKPTTQEIGEYHLGLLADEEAKFVEAYLKQHPHLARQEAILQEFLAAVDRDTVHSRTVSQAPRLGQKIQVLIAELLQGSQWHWLLGVFAAAKKAFIRPAIIRSWSR